MNDFLRNFYQDKDLCPGTLCVLQALPGYSDDNILQTVSLLEPPDKALKWLQKYHTQTRSLESPVPNWELVDTEVYPTSGDSLYQAVIVGYYKLIEG